MFVRSCLCLGFPWVSKQMTWWWQMIRIQREEGVMEKVGFLTPHKLCGCQYFHQGKALAHQKLHLGSIESSCYARPLQMYHGTIFQTWTQRLFFLNSFKRAIASYWCRTLSSIHSASSHFGGQRTWRGRLCTEQQPQRCDSATTRPAQQWHNGSNKKLITWMFWPWHHATACYLNTSRPLNCLVSHHLFTVTATIVIQY